METRAAAFVARRWSVPRAPLRVDVRSLHGGLESAVHLAEITGASSHASVPTQMVIKHLAPALQREGDVYELLWAHLERPPAVRVYGREACGADTYLYLESARAFSTWPWSDPARAASVCRALARLHDEGALPRERFAWDYESHLEGSAAATLEAARTARDVSGRRYWRRFGDLRRVVEALAAIRSHLMSGETAVIHGDVHPGNVVLRHEGADMEVVLLDWARARIGSPLEDVASWLHSLGCWEPQARRRHDTLMRAYLDARTTSRRFAPDVRVDYWLASASNGLSGAIRYHLAVLADPSTPESARYDSHRALTAWERVFRRAAPIVRTSLARCS